MESHISARWSNEHVVADHRDIQGNCMAINYYGSHAILAGRKTIAVVDLDKPQEVVKKMTRQSKWEVCALEWSPTHYNANRFALCCNQKAELLTWREDGDIVSNDFLRAHTRVISDMNWSPLNPDYLATCSVDTHINIWDAREPRKPATSLSAAAGASQVKWNRLIDTNLATAHESDVRLWDIRKGNIPIQYISAHSLKIHGLDWSTVDKNGLATSSQDGKVKFWDVTNPRHCDKMLSSGAPVWRARFTPFGQGLITAAVPQFRKGEYNLRLWNISNNVSSVHSFIGHTDVVLGFQWRRIKDDDMHQYQLVTWSKDQNLRIWTIDPQLQKACGGDDNQIEDIFPDLDENKNDDAFDAGNNTNNNSTCTSPRDNKRTASPQHSSNVTFRVTRAAEDYLENQRPVLLQSSSCYSKLSSDVKSNISRPKSLQQEFSLIDMDIPNVSIEEMNAMERKCSVKVNTGSDVVYLQIFFPPGYPNRVSPLFDILPNTTIEKENQLEILKVLLATCEQNVKQGKPCLEPCLRQLVAAIKPLSKSNNNTNNDSSYRVEAVQHTITPLNMYGCYQDSNVPFPRTSGARFSGPGLLVCFARPFHLQNMSIRNDSTPRSLSALAAYQMNYMSASKTSRGNNSASSQRSQYNLMYPASAIARSPKNEPCEMTLSMFYSKSKKSKGGRKSYRQISPENPESRGLAGRVVLYDVSAIMPVSINLAKSYVLDSNDIVGICSINAAAAASLGRKDLYQVWNVVGQCANLSLTQFSNCTNSMWAHHLLGKEMLQSIMEYYTKLQDVQTVSMLCCVLGLRTEMPMKNKSHSETASQGSGGSPYHTIHSFETNMDNWNVFSPNLKTNRSNSLSDSLDDPRDEMKNSVGMQDIIELEKDLDATSDYKLLNPKLNWQYDLFKKIYAEFLYHWNLLLPRAEILKYVSVPSQKHKGVEFINECQSCKREFRGVHCFRCNKYSFNCVICHIAVKGSSSFCVLCGHGGHSPHLKEWFEVMDSCPSGCGCNCLQQTEIFD